MPLSVGLVPAEATTERLRTKLRSPSANLFQLQEYLDRRFDEQVGPAICTGAEIYFARGEVVALVKVDCMASVANRCFRRGARMAWT